MLVRESKVMPPAGALRWTASVPDTNSELVGESTLWAVGKMDYCNVKDRADF